MAANRMSTSSSRAQLRNANVGVPLVLHVIHALRTGGLENGLVNLINHMPPQRYRHAVLCMTDYSNFKDRICRPDVDVIALHKETLSRLGLYRALVKCFARLSPSIVHGRNWDGLDAAIPAWLAGVPIRVQGEHGRDMHDLDGTNSKQVWLRRATHPFTTHYTTVSRDLADYLVNTVGVNPKRVTQIYNGVDTERFVPGASEIADCELGRAANEFVIGTVGRLVDVKDQRTLLRACAGAICRQPQLKDRLRLVIVGDGPLRASLEAEAAALGLANRTVFAGGRNDVPAWLRAMDLFVLPSLAEGISNTLLEAMSTGLPSIASNVGGNADLSVDGRTGRIVAPGDSEAIGAAIVEYVGAPELLVNHGRAARERVLQNFGIAAMVEGYASLYDRLLNGARRAKQTGPAVAG